MDNNYNKIGLFSGSMLKIFACIFMLIDHIGLTFYRYDPEIFEIFRIVGRLAFPMFAFFIAEGSRYSKHKLKRFLTIFSIGLAFLVFYYFYDGIIYGNIFLTFSVSILLDAFLFQCKKLAFKASNTLQLIIMLAGFAAAVLLAYQLYSFIRFEYGFWGMLIPVMINLTNFKDIEVKGFFKRIDCHWFRILFLTLGLIPLSINGNMGNIQFYSLLSVIPLIFYNGKPGCKKLKYVFYIFYPAHLVIIEGVALIISQILN